MKGKSSLGILFALLLVGSMFIMPLPTKAAVVGNIKVGIIGPYGLPHWSPAGMKEAAEMARDEVNDGGGIYLPDADPPGYYNITLVFRDEYAYPDILPSQAAISMEELCDPAEEGCDIVIGGFRTECVLAEIPVAVSYGVPFLINGASTSGLTNQTTEPYVWRINPINSTMLFYTIAGGLGGYLLPEKLNPIFGADLDNNPSTPNQTKVAVLSEDLAWTIEMHTMLSHPAYYPSILGPYANVTYQGRIPDGETNVASYIQGVIDSEARLLIHIFSGVSGVPVIMTWKAMSCGALPVGINVLGQLQNHWDTTGGACDYECILNFAGTRTPIIPGVTEVFWDNFVAKSGGYWPLYTAWGAYDGIHNVAETLEAIGQMDKDLLKAYYENPAYARVGLNGIFKFTSDHDVNSPEYGPTWPVGLVRAFIVQWQVIFGSGPIDGRMEVVCPVDQVWSKKWAIPPWMYELVEDINYDGEVDMRDVGAAARAFGTYPGHERWEKEADINFDNNVDMRDIGAIARKFGTIISLPVPYP
jgi:ABC-type branched-subunit amino acid transport system substrate-binding protein